MNLTYQILSERVSMSSLQRITRLTGDYFTTIDWTLEIDISSQVELLLRLLDSFAGASRGDSGGEHQTVCRSGIHHPK